MQRYFWTIFDICLIVIISLLFFGAFIGTYHLIIPDEGRYAEVAREMLASGNWLTPHLDGVVFMDKPIFVYWLEALAFKYFGFNEFAARIFPVCFGVLGVALTYIAGRKLYNRRAAFLSAFVLMTSLLYFLSSHYVDMDLAVAVFISGALWFFIMAMNLKPGLQRRAYLWVAYIFAAIAVLTKGLIGIVFPIMIIGAWILVLNEWRQLKRMCIPTGLLIFFALVLPWYIDMQIHNPDFFHYFFWQQQFNRFTGSGFNMHNPFYYYIIVIFAGMVPWAVFFPQAIMSATRKALFHRREAKNEVFILLWPLLITVFFSIPKSKIIGYILPVFPPLALLVGVYLDQYWEKLRDMKSLRWALAGLFLIAILLAIAVIVVSFMPSLTDVQSKLYLFSMAAMLFIACFIAWRLRKKHAPFKHIFYVILVASAIILLTASAAVSTFQLKNEKSLALLTKKQMQPGDKIVAFYHYSMELPFYIQHRIYVVLPNWKDPHLRQEDNWRSELAKGMDDTKQPKYMINFKQFKAMWDSPARVLVITSKSKLNGQFVPSISKTYKVIGGYGKDLLITNH